MNRIDRVTAILIQLQSRKIVKAQDIADRFKISLRTVYRDVKTLEEAGVPVIGEAGVGYSIMDSYRLPPVMFTKEEATAFLTAEKLIEKFTDPSTEQNYKSAMFKVRAVLRGTEKDMLENMEERIEVIRRLSPFNADSVDNTLPVILKSIAEKKVLQIHYTAFHSNEKTKRDIEAVGIFYSTGYWHTIGFCRLRNDYRDFRTDRISQIQITDKQIDKQHPSLKEYLDRVIENQQLEKVVIQIDKKVTRYIQEAKYYYGFVSEKNMGEEIEMTFLTPSIDGFIRWYLMFADNARIVSPVSLNTFLKDFINKLSEKI
ncbi:MAG: YafY family transcriptional regulator [Bacteroidetes bacterium]|nr:YafY family transcriptional regulator [Bacteroidota bacterium]